MTKPKTYEVEIVTEQKGEMIKFTALYETETYFDLEEIIRQEHGQVEFEIINIYPKPIF